MSAHVNRRYWTPGRVAALAADAPRPAAPVGHIPAGTGPDQPVLQQSDNGGLFVAVYDDASGWMYMPVPPSTSASDRGESA